MATKPKEAHCCVGGCNNDDRYPNKYAIHSHVKTMRFFKFTTAKSKRKIWIENISAGLENFSPGSANHFVNGEPTTENPHPTLFLTLLQNKYASTPKKRKIIDWEQASRSQAEKEIGADNTGELEIDIDAGVTAQPESQSSQSDDSDWEPDLVSPDLHFEEVAREGMVTEYTGLPSSEIFCHLFDTLRPKAKNMNYWKGQVQVSKEKPNEVRSQGMSATFQLFEEAGVEAPSCKRGPKRKLTLQQEFLMVLMKIRLGLMNHDLSFRFKISTALVSTTVTTWWDSLQKNLAGW